MRRVFGASSEKLDAAQLQPFLSGVELVQPAAEQQTQASKSKGLVQPPRKAKQPRLPQNLPVVEEVIDPEPVKTAPEQFRQIGQEVSEQLDYEPATPCPHLKGANGVQKVTLGSQSCEHSAAASFS